MPFTDEHKHELEAKIVEIIAASLEQEKIAEADLSPISTFVLEKIDTVKTQEELVAFLKELSQKWPIFEGVVTVEEGEINEVKEQAAVENIEQLIESGNLDQALAAAKEATAQAE